MTTPQELITTAKKYLGVHHDVNGDKQIAQWLKNVGLDLKDEKGEYYAYCCAFSYGICKECGIDIFPKTAGVLRAWESIPNKYKQSFPTIGSFFVWKGKSHIGLVTGISVDKDNKIKIKTIEGNTSNPNVGSNDDRNGGWVMEKERSGLVGIYPGGIELLGFINLFI